MEHGGGYLPSHSINEVNNCFAVRHTETQKLVYFCQHTKRLLEIIIDMQFLSLQQLEGELYLLLTSKSPNQHTRKTLFTRVAYTNYK